MVPLLQIFEVQLLKLGRYAFVKIKYNGLVEIKWIVQYLNDIFQKIWRVIVVVMICIECS